MNNILPAKYKNFEFKPLTTWEGKKNSTKFCYNISDLITLGLYFEGTSKPAPAEQKEFFEGLWNYDLIELFLEINENEYIEINLSINGAWWTAYFDSYRVRSTKKSPIELKEVSCYSDNYKHLVIAELELQNIKTNGKYNITAIVNNYYYSKNLAANLQKPDFHLKELRK